MKLLQLPKYRIQKTVVQQRLSWILSKTRQRTSLMVKFWKHLGQIVWERIPVLSPLHELMIGKGFISEVRIIPYSLSRWWRILIIGTESIFAYILIVHGRSLLTEARHHLTNIFFHGQFPHHISHHILFLMIIMMIGTVGYYGMIKPGDLKQAIKEHQEEYTK